MLIDWHAFAGEVPRKEPDELPGPAAQDAQHCDFNHGDLRPLPLMGLKAELAGTIRSLFTLDGLNFLSWSYDVDAVRGPVIEDTNKRIYFTTSAGLWMTFEDQAKPGGGEPSTKYKAGVPAPTAPLVLALDSSTVAMKVTATFFYEAAGVKYQEQTISLTQITAGKKYWFVPPDKNAPPGSGSGPVIVDEALKILGYRTIGTEGMQYQPDTITVTGNASIRLSNGTVIENVEAVNDTDSREHLVTTLWSLTKFSTLYDVNVGAPSVPTSTDDNTAPNSSATPAGYTPEGAMPMLKIKAVMTAVAPATTDTPLFECYSAGSTFNVSKPAATITLTADSSIVGRMNVDIEYTPNDSSGIKETRAYTFTFINQFNEESIPAATASIDVNVFEKVRMVVTPTGADGCAPITKARIYRTATGATGATEWFYVMDCDLSQGYVWLDSKKTSEIGPDVLQSWTWDRPPADLHGLTYIGNGMLAGISGTRVYICEPYRPHAWPVDYMQQHPSTPIRLVPHHNSVIVTTTGFPYMLTGSTPGGMVQQRLAAQQGAVSKAAHADLGDYVAYATNDGVALVSGGQVSIQQSLSLWGRKKWRELYGGRLHLMRFAANDGQLICYFEGGGAGQFIVRFDESTGNLTKHLFDMTAAFVLPDTDALYVGSGKMLYTFDGGVLGLAIWWSREVVLTKPRNLGALQILCDGECHATVYADGVPVSADPWLFTDAAIVRLPTHIIARRWSVKLELAGKVKAVYLAGTVLDLQQV